ncbi:hypothetical protein QE152_g8083 [Popillia japonica]|uniref:Uncharacterized protein n=1 Tax=Popillia japonica TaxID=7064 RepID=A0AAW1MCY2_POPJA
MSSEDIYNLLEEPASQETNAIGESSGSEAKHIEDNEYDSSEIGESSGSEAKHIEDNEYDSSEIEVENVDQDTDIAEHGESEEEEDQDFYTGRSKRECRSRY